jgi:hypothetical protein
MRHLGFPRSIKKNSVNNCRTSIIGYFDGVSTLPEDSLLYYKNPSSPTSHQLLKTITSLHWAVMPGTTSWNHPINEEPLRGVLALSGKIPSPGGGAPGIPALTFEFKYSASYSSPQVIMWLEFIK